MGVNKTPDLSQSHPQITVNSERPKGERVKACSGRSEMNYPAGHTAPPEAARNFLSRGRFSWPTVGPWGNSIKALGSHKNTPHSSSPQLEEQAAAQTQRYTLLPSSPPQFFASYSLVTSLFYFLKTRQFKRRKCSKLAHGKKWQKETVPLYQASNSRAGKGVSVQYVPDS